MYLILNYGGVVVNIHFLNGHGGDLYVERTWTMWTLCIDKSNNEMGGISLMINVDVQFCMVSPLCAATTSTVFA